MCSARWLFFLHIGPFLHLSISKACFSSLYLLCKVLGVFVLQPTTLAAQQGAQTYDTALSLTAQGGNGKLEVPVWQLFARDPALTYENVTINVAPVTPASTGSEASAGSYLVKGGASQANILWDGSTQPTRTCVVRTRAMCCFHVDCQV